MLALRALGVWLAFAIVGTGAEPSPLTIIGQDKVIVLIDKAGNGTHVLRLTNTSAKPVKLDPDSLNVTDFSHSRSDGGSYSLNAQTTLTGAPAEVAPGATFAVKMLFAQVWETGDSTAQLRFKDAAICDLVARREPAPFNIQVDSSTAEIVFERGKTASIVLVNNDHSSYRFKCSLVAVGKFRSTPGTYDLPPNGRRVIEIPASEFSSSFFAAGTLRDDVLDAAVELEPVSDASVPPQPARHLPVKIRLRYWDGYVQQFTNILLTALLVLIGMLASLWFRYFIPNSTAGLRVRRQLNDTENKLNGIGSDLPSQPRTVLEATIDSCRHRLYEVPWMFPGFPSVLAEVQAKSAMCNQWVDCAYGVAEVLGETSRQLQAGLPPTLMALIEDRCERALRPFLSGFTNADELLAMTTAVKEARKYLEAAVSASSVPELEDMIKDREARIQPALEALCDAYPQYSELFRQVEAKQTEPFSPARYRERDTLSLKMELLLDYRNLAMRAGAGSMPQVISAVAAQVGGGPINVPPTLNRILAQYDRFLHCAESESYQGLKRARVYITEMQQCCYPTELLTELAKSPPAVQIHFAPRPIKLGVPVHYSLRFLRDALNDVSALSEFSCRWDFGDGSSTEAGWDVYHRYCVPGQYQITVLIADPADNIVTTSEPITLAVNMEEHRTRVFRLKKKLSFTAEAKIEGMRLGFVLAIALGAVFGSARGVVEKADMFQAIAGLIGLGFAADTLKNVVTDRPSDK